MKRCYTCNDPGTVFLTRKLGVIWPKEYPFCLQCMVRSLRGRTSWTHIRFIGQAFWVEIVSKRRGVKDGKSEA